MSDVQNTGDDVDALYDSIMGKGEGNDGPSVEQNEFSTEQKVVTANPTPPPTTTPEDLYEFNWNNKQIKANRENVLKWASQGYDYSQKMQEFKQRQADIDSKWQQAEQLNKTYGPIDEWVKGNPEKWDQLQQAISGMEASGANPQLLSKLQALEAKVQQASKFIEQTQQVQEAERIAKEDSELDAEIKSIQEKYKDLDWKSVDTEGRHLEARIVNHAVNNGIKSFKTAFNDLMSDDLIKIAETRGRESLGKERQAKQASGLLGTSATPTKGLSKPTNIKSKSYDDLMREGLEELGIS